MTLSVKEGEVDFKVPSTGETTKTWYRISGRLSADVVPLVCLHGGPGACSDYLWPLEALYNSHNIPVICYDQIGNGRSTHLRNKVGDVDFWTEELFMAELTNLLEKIGVSGDGKQFDILGQSWGGMLGARYATFAPKGMRKLVISNSPASIPLWLEACNKLRAELPQDIQAVLKQHEDAGTTDSAEYDAAVTEWNKRHLCRVYPFPKEIEAMLNWLKEDGTTYNTMNGPSEFHVVGSLKEWTIIPDLHKITIPTLVLNAVYDEAQDSTVMPYVESIKGAKWHCFKDASHCSYFEQPEEYLKVVGDFLASSS